MARNITPTNKALLPPKNPPANAHMKVDDFNVTQVSKLIREANEIAVVPSPTSKVDGFCAAVGLYNMLQDRSKNVSFVYAGLVPTVGRNLISTGEIESDVGQRELTVEIDYSGTTAVKARYSTENDVLKVTLGPVPKNFDANRVKTEVSGFDFDLVFVLGAQKLEDLGQVYTSLNEELKKTNIVNVDIKNNNTRYGVVNVVDKRVDSLSHLVFNKSALWNLKPGKKSAKALLTGIANT